MVGAQPRSGAFRKDAHMSTASIKAHHPELSPATLVRMTIEACRLAKEAAGALLPRPLVTD